MFKKGNEIREELEQLFPKDGRVVIDCASCNELQQRIFQNLYQY